MTPDLDDHVLAERARARNHRQWAAALRRSDAELTPHAALRLAEAPIEGVADEIWRQEATRVVAAELGLDLDGADGHLLLWRLQEEHGALIDRLIMAGPDRPLSSEDERVARELAGLAAESERPLTDIAGELLDVPARSAPALCSHPVVVRAGDLLAQRAVEPHAGIGAHRVFA